MSDIVDLTVKLNDQLTLQNPVLTASGTFGYGDEVPELVDVNRLGDWSPSPLRATPGKATRRRALPKPPPACSMPSVWPISG